MNDLQIILDSLGLAEEVISNQFNVYAARCDYFILQLYAVVFVYAPVAKNDFYLINAGADTDFSLIGSTKVQIRKRQVWCCEDFDSALNVAELLKKDRAKIVQTLLCGHE